MSPSNIAACSASSHPVLPDEAPHGASPAPEPAPLGRTVVHPMDPPSLPIKPLGRLSCKLEDVEDAHSDDIWVPRDTTRHVRNAFDIVPDVTKTLLAIIPFIRKQENLKIIAALQPQSLTALAMAAHVALCNFRTWGGSKAYQLNQPVPEGISTPGMFHLRSFTQIYEENTVLGRCCRDVEQHFNECAQPLPVEASHINRNSDWPRTQELNKLCKEREALRCPVSGTRDMEGMCIIPHAVAAVNSKPATVWWLFVTVLFGAHDRDRLWKVCGGKSSFSPINGIAMCHHMHREGDAGRVDFDVSEEGEQDGQEPGHRRLGVRVGWRNRDQENDRPLVAIPSNPDEQIEVVSPTSYRRNVLEGGRWSRSNEWFRLYTVNPQALPLPNVALLQLRVEMWMMIRHLGLDQPGAPDLSNKRSRSFSGPTSVKSAKTSQSGTPSSSRSGSVTRNVSHKSVSGTQSKAGGPAPGDIEQMDDFDYDENNYAGSDTETLDDSDDEARSVAVLLRRHQFDESDYGGEYFDSKIIGQLLCTQGDTGIGRAEDCEHVDV